MKSSSTLNLCTMKNTAKDSNKSWPVLKFLVYFFLIFSLSYIFYSVIFVSDSCSQQSLIPLSAKKQSLNFHHHKSEIALAPSGRPTLKPQAQTNPSHLVFGIASSAKLWNHRKNYIKQWWRPNEMRGFVWLDKAVKTGHDEKLLPSLKISSDTSKFKYKNRKGDRSVIRISRIVSETLRQGMKNVRWFVMGDDDTVFVVDNLVRVLQKYDHNQYYYIGSASDSHFQNIYFSYNMAFGGGGFAISYPLAKALEKIQDNCIQRYPDLYGSDERIQACMAELGVPLTKEYGFHQFDVYGNVFGLLAAHPIAPLVSLHHLDLVEPIFPNMDRIGSLERLKVPMKLDSAGLVQQSICYDKTRTWTVSVSWGFTVQIFQGILSARDMEIPARTFLNWYPKTDHRAYAFNTRPVSQNTCEGPVVYYLSNAIYHAPTNQTVTEYIQHQVGRPACRSKMPDPSHIARVEVYKKPNPYLWNKSRRRNCCRIMRTKKKGTIAIDVGVCQKDEIIEMW